VEFVANAGKKKKSARVAEGIEGKRSSGLGHNDGKGKDIKRKNWANVSATEERGL